MVRKFRELMIYIIAMLLYFIWPYLTQFIINQVLVSNINTIYLTFASNMIISLIIIGIYKDELKGELLKFNEHFSKNILYVIKWSLISLAMFLVVNQIIYMLIPNINQENTNIILNMFKDNKILLFINTFIFYSVVEELVFKFPFKKILSNKWLFIIITGFLNAFYTVYFTSTSKLSLVFIIPYTILLSCFSYVYYKKDNIIFPIMTRIIYNLITILVLLS
ncbi:MAG: CPBP family glutamic-type intramembrane protease [Tenericutes bacterium]|nr:CPBP family glutamic-type intramembrane protease [Mycoplasmatota bacterium]